MRPGQQAPAPPRARSDNVDGPPLPVIVCALRAPGTPPLPPPPAPAAPPPAPVAFGSVALAGRMRQMEDVVALRPGFFVWPDGSPIHFFAVFDGHGGPHVSEMCKEQMPAALEEELTLAAALLNEQPTQKDALGAGCCQRGNVAAAPEECCQCGLRGEVIGSTAVVALLVRDLVVVANSGDSRAVISRNDGSAVALSIDHESALTVDECS